MYGVRRTGGAMGGGEGWRRRRGRGEESAGRGREQGASVNQAELPLFPAIFSLLSRVTREQEDE